VQGVITAIDAGKNTITVRVPLNDGTKQTKEETFTLGNGTKVLLADLVNKGDPLPEGKLADLSEGTGVVVQFDADRKNVTTVTARGPSLVTEVKSFDAASKTLTVVIKNKNGAEEKSLTLIPNIKVLLNEGGKKGDPDKEGKLDDLKEGVHVSVQLSVDQSKALAIRLQPRTLSGTLVGHDAGNNTITISSKGDGDRTFTVANNATLVDLVVGSRVTLRFSVLDKDKVVQAQGQKE
jgi:transposase